MVTAQEGSCDYVDASGAVNFVFRAGLSMQSYLPDSMYRATSSCQRLGVKQQGELLSEASPQKARMPVDDDEVPGV
jgi:hypothetical protein